MRTYKLVPRLSRTMVIHHHDGALGISKVKSWLYPGTGQPEPPILVPWPPDLKWNWSENFLITKYLKLCFPLALEFALVLHFLDPSLWESNLVHSWFSGWIRLVVTLPKGLQLPWISNLLHCTLDLACQCHMYFIDTVASRPKMVVPNWVPT